MFKKFKIFCFLIFSVSFFYIFIPATKAETAKKQFSKGYTDAGTAMEYNTVADPTGSSIEITIGKIINIILSFLGVIFLVLMIYGGYTWMLARGNETEIEKAKKIITNSIIGLIIVISAYAITQLAGSLIGTAEAQGLKDGFVGGPLKNVANGAKVDTGATIDGIISSVIELTLSFLGVIFLILMIYGGFLWMTAHDNESQVETSKKLIRAAIIGLIIVVGAYAITYFVVDNITKDYIN